MQHKWPLGGWENRMAAKRSKKANYGTFGQPNSLESVDQTGQNVSAAAPADNATMLIIGLIFLFWFRDNSKLPQLVSFVFLKLLGFILRYFK